MAVRRIERFGDVERLHMTRSVAGRAVYWTSVYRVGDVLVDSGCSTGRAVFVPWLKERAVRTVLTTHEHEDHIGNHAVLPRDATVWAPRLAAHYLEQGHPPFPLYRRLVWGYHERAPGARIVGDKVDRFRVFQTNGHSVDHVAFLDEHENALFCGDAYMGRFKSARLEEDVLTELATLRRMAELDPATLFPAHGPVIPRPRERLLETVAHYEDLQRKAWRLHDRGWPLWRIARELLGGPGFMTLFSLGEFSEEKLVRNLLRARPDQSPQPSSGM